MRMLLFCALASCVPIRNVPFAEVVEGQRWCFLYVPQLGDYRTLKACYSEMSDCVDGSMFYSKVPKQRVLSECFRQDQEQVNL